MNSREETIIRGAITLAQNGRDMDHIKVQDIADAAGVGKGTVYEYFSSKEEVLTRAMQYCAQQEIDKIEGLVHSLDVGTIALDAGLDYVQELISTRACSYHILINAIGNSLHMDIFHEEAARLERLLKEQLRLGKENGEIRADVDYDYFSYTVTAAFASFAHSLVLPRVFGTEKLRQFTKEILIRALC